MAMVISTT